jgi:hypothetical protein
VVLTLKSNAKPPTPSPLKFTNRQTHAPNNSRFVAVKRYYVCNSKNHQVLGVVSHANRQHNDRAASKSIQTFLLNFLQNLQNI